MHIIHGACYMKKGFTLIELLVVVLIIGILSAIALPQYKKAVLKARFAEVVPNLKAIGQAQQACFLEKGSACDFNEMAITPPGRPGISSTGDEVSTVRRTEHFEYDAYVYDAYSNELWGSASYLEEDVCFCYYRTGEIVFSQDPEGDCYNAPSLNYASVITVPEVSTDECKCC